MSVCEPNVKPSYHHFTSAFLSDKSNNSRAPNTSDSVKPKYTLYFSEVVVITLRLFRSENIDCFDTLVIPVITARSR